VADAYTGAAALTVDQTAYDRAVYHASDATLTSTRSRTSSPRPSRWKVRWSSSDRVRPDSRDGLLNESTDVDAVAMADSQVTSPSPRRAGRSSPPRRSGAPLVRPLRPGVADVVSYWAAASLTPAGTALVWWFQRPVRSAPARPTRQAACRARRLSRPETPAWFSTQGRVRDAVR
jgi:hypothetical protein